MRAGIVHSHASPCTCHATIGRALAALGHEAVDCDSEDVPLRAAELARLDLVFNYTDRFRGEGMLRSFVSQILESRGARVVGSGAAACFLADDKAAACERLREAGIPVPEGSAVSSIAEGRRIDLPWPRVVKAAFEHMSRGLFVADDLAGQDVALDASFRDHRASVLVQRWIAGREIALTVLGNACGDAHVGLDVLPPAEWPLFPGARVLDSDTERGLPTPMLAGVQPDVRERMSRLARRAFAVLGLADVVRFDVRLDEAGTPWFLEANTTPSLESDSPTFPSAAASGMDEVALVLRIMDVALARLGRR